MVVACFLTKAADGQGLTQTQKLRGMEAQAKSLSGIEQPKGACDSGLFPTNKSGYYQLRAEDGGSSPKSHVSSQMLRYPSSFYMEYDPPKASLLWGFSCTPLMLQSAHGQKRGVLIYRIFRGFAHDIGLDWGDIIYDLNNYRVTEPWQVEWFLLNVTGDTVRVRFQRGLRVYDMRKPLNKEKLAAARKEFYKVNDEKPAAPSRETVHQSIPLFEDFTVELINAQRLNAKLPALNKDAKLSNMAHDKAERLARDQTASISNAIDLNHAVGECICTETFHESLHQTIQACQKDTSPVNVFDRSFQRVGVGIAMASNNRVFMVQEFDSAGN